jgi:thiosulfate/3-mercaptopyruvate sulfurtransferase
MEMTMLTAQKRDATVWILLLLCTFCVWLVPPALAQAQQSKATPLVTVEWLKANLSKSNIVLVDASHQSQYREQHIEGAVNANVFAFGSHEVSQAEMEKLLRSWGVNAGSKIVLYDAGADFMATSMFYELLYQGYPLEDMHILDGGLAKWVASGGAVTRMTPPARSVGNVALGSIRAAVRAMLPATLSASGDGGRHVLVEGLEPPFYFGGAQFFDRPGHIPNAIMMPTNDLFNADKTFKSAAEISRMFNHVGITPDRHVTTYCGGGVAASLSFFAAKFILQYPEVQLFKGSQREWLRDERSLPFWTFAAPNRLRDKQWVHGWNSDMMRMMEASRLNIIDIREAEVRARGHIPHSLAVPASAIKSQARTPQALADALGAAGVAQAHDAVLVSDGGITPEAALAMWLLEGVGQTRVSILAGSFDDWALAGLPTVNPAKKDDKRIVLPVRAQQYRAKTNPLYSNGLLLPLSSYAATTKEVTPRIVIASGRQKPEALKLRTQDKLIHLNYADFLDKLGNPKPAHNIWSMLEKAGVSRYAEIICIADEPGEAAVNYVVLKLMGYVDVKVATVG